MATADFKLLYEAQTQAQAQPQGQTQAQAQAQPQPQSRNIKVEEARQFIKRCFGSSSLDSSGMTLMHEKLISNCGYTDYKDPKFLQELFNHLPYLPWTHLNLADCEIDDKLAEDLAKSLEHHSTLQCLILCRNKIQNKGALALAAALKNNQVLVELNLNCNFIRTQGGKAILDCWQERVTRGTKSNMFINQLSLSDNPFNLQKSDNPDCFFQYNFFTRFGSLLKKSTFSDLKETSDLEVTPKETYFLIRYMPILSSTEKETGVRSAGVTTAVITQEQEQDQHFWADKRPLFYS